MIDLNISLIFQHQERAGWDGIGRLLRCVGGRWPAFRVPEAAAGWQHATPPCTRRTRARSSQVGNLPSNGPGAITGTATATTMVVEPASNRRGDHTCITMMLSLK
jgi:hypothetical protein